MEKKNIKNLPFYIKYLDIICYAVCLIFFLFAVLTCFSQYFKEKAIEDKFNAMLDYCNSVNSSISNNIINGSNSNNSGSSNEQIYFDGKTAIIDAYNKFYVNANSFSVDATGNLILSAPAGLYAKLQMDLVIQRYTKTKAYEELRVCPIEGNIPDAFIGRVKSAVKRLKEGVTNPQVYYTTNAKFEGTKIVADFTNAEYYTSEEELFYNDYYLTINEDSIKEVTYFKIKKSGNEIKNYYIQVKLHPAFATEKYTEILSKQIGCSKLKFSSITLTAILDGKGNLISLSNFDQFDFSMGFNCQASSSFTFKIIGINEPNNFVYTGF